MDFCIPPRCCKRKLLRRSFPIALNVMCVYVNIDGLFSPYCGTRLLKSTAASSSSTSTTCSHCHLGKWCVCTFWKRVKNSCWAFKGAAQPLRALLQHQVKGSTSGHVENDYLKWTFMCTIETTVWMDVMFDVPFWICQPKTSALMCVLVQVGGRCLTCSWSILKYHNVWFQSPIGINIKHTTLYSRNKIGQVYRNTLSPCGHWQLTSFSKHQHATLQTNPYHNEIS